MKKIQIKKQKIQATKNINNIKNINNTKNEKI